MHGKIADARTHLGVCERVACGAENGENGLTARKRKEKSGRAGISKERRTRNWRVAAAEERVVKHAWWRTRPRCDTGRVRRIGVAAGVLAAQVASAFGDA